MSVTPKFCISIVFSFSWELKCPQENLKTMLMQNFGVTNIEHYGMLWYFLEWSIQSSARARTHVILAGKSASRRHSTTSFSENVLVAKTSYQMLGILSFSDCGEGFTSFNGNERTNFCGEKSTMNVFRGVYF